MLLDTRVRKKVIRNRQSAKKRFRLQKNLSNFLFPNFFLKMIRGGLGFLHPVSERSHSHRQHTDDPNADNPRADRQHTVFFSAGSGLSL